MLWRWLNESEFIMPFIACLHIYTNVNLLLGLPLSSRSLHDLNDWTRTHRILHNLGRAFAYTELKYLEIYDLDTVKWMEPYKILQILCITYIGFSVKQFLSSEQPLISLNPNSARNIRSESTWPPIIQPSSPDINIPNKVTQEWILASLGCKRLKDS